MNSVGISSLQIFAFEIREYMTEIMIIVGSVTAQMGETQYRTGSLYGGSLQGFDWPTQLFRQQPVLGLWHRARGTSS